MAAVSDQIPGEIRIVDDVPQAFAALVAAEAPRSLALSGGNTASEGYERLAGVALDWSSIDVYFGDERWVAVDDPESNEGMARQVLLDAVASACRPFAARRR